MRYQTGIKSIIDTSTSGIKTGKSINDTGTSGIKTGIKSINQVSKIPELLNVSGICEVSKVSNWYQKYQ